MKRLTTGDFARLDRASSPETPSIAPSADTPYRVEISGVGRRPWALNLMHIAVIGAAIVLWTSLKGRQS